MELSDIIKAAFKKAFPGEDFSFVRVLPDSLKAMGIAEGESKTSIWATHPSLEDRIAALQNLPPCA